MLTRLCLAALLSDVFSPALAAGGEPIAWFEQGVRADAGDPGGAARAYAWYLKAAEAGLPEAEFNVAAMLDSGRGVRPDAAEAATWYARAAARGDRRAAYNLGLIYVAGQGVPANRDLARAWFAASGLPAARDHLAGLRLPGSPADAFSAPTLAAPSAGARLAPGQADVELVWTSRQQPETARFFVEVRELGSGAGREIFAAFAPASSTVVPLHEPRGDYAWRVFAVEARAGRYAGSGWRLFSVAPSLDLSRR